MYRLSKVLASKNQDEKESVAVQWLLKSANAGHTLSQFEIGLHYLFGMGIATSVAKAVYFLELAAAKDHSEALYYLGFIQLHGIAGSESPERAYLLFTQAAALNSVKAFCSLGFLCQHGIGCKLDLLKSKNWYLKAAQAGNPPAQLGLGLLHLTSGSPYEAFQWLFEAAHNDIIASQALLAKMHSKGIGTDRSVVKALMWCFVVQNNEFADPDSKRIVEVCCNETKLIAQQHEIDEAYTMASNWESKKVKSQRGPCLGAIN